MIYDKIIITDIWKNESYQAKCYYIGYYIQWVNIYCLVYNELHRHEKIDIINFLIQDFPKLTCNNWFAFVYFVKHFHEDILCFH